MTDPGEAPPPIYLDQTEARKAEKKFLETGPPLSQGLDDRHPLPSPPPYLKDWMMTATPLPEGLDDDRHPPPTPAYPLT